MLSPLQMNNIISESIQKAKIMDEMLTKGHHTQAIGSFGNEAVEMFANCSGNKIQLSEPEQDKIVRNILKIANNKIEGFSNLSGLRAQFADPTGSTIGNFTLQMLNMFIIEFGSNLNQVSYLLRKYLPQMPISALEFMLDRGGAVFGRLGAADYGSPMPIRNQMQTYGTKNETNRYGEKVQIFTRDMLFTREKGSNNMADGAAGLQQKLAYETLYGTVRAETSFNLDMSDALLRNGYSYAGQPISSGQPAGNVFTFPSALGAYTVATGAYSCNNSIDPLQIISAMLSSWLPLLTANKAARELIVHPVVFNMIFQNTNVQKWLQQRFIVSGEEVSAKGEILKFYNLPLLGGIRIVTDETVWKSTPNSVNAAGSTYTNGSYVMGGTNTTITQSTFNGLIGIDTSAQGGMLGATVLSPDALGGGYISGKSNYGVQVFDRTIIEPENPHMLIIPYATYKATILAPEMVFTMNPNITIQ